MADERKYLGDGLYASDDGYQIALAASNGMDDGDVVYLEPPVLRELLAYALKRKLISAHTLRTMADAQEPPFNG